MASEKGKIIGSIIIMTGVVFAIIGLATDRMGFYAFIGMILLFVGRFFNEYF
ncbi:hypothetical protein C8N25_101151 [Algoriphagus antarcticus]|uniref:Uncharacterized protein n=1 Tax=Algoriphagus antarcticus TaxID=238540 RepID=A0A3E0E7T1_9BACT|nr:hypothetical protein C8N25_101151 [Algoriphagus antarcticus]